MNTLFQVNYASIDDRQRMELNNNNMAYEEVREGDKQALVLKLFYGLEREKNMISAALCAIQVTLALRFAAQLSSSHSVSSVCCSVGLKPFLLFVLALIIKPPLLTLLFVFQLKIIHTIVALRFAAQCNQSHSCFSVWYSIQCNPFFCFRSIPFKPFGFALIGMQTILVDTA